MWCRETCKPCEQAVANRKLARTGGDPLADKRRVQGLPTFAEAATTVIDQKRAGWKTPAQVQAWRGSLERYAFPRIGRRLAVPQLRLLLARCGIACVPHGFRSSFRDWAAEETDHPREVVEAALAAMRRLAAQYPRYGYRRIRIFLKREGHTMSTDRTHRLWRQAGLQVPRRRPRRRVALSRPRPVPATAVNHVWAYDFVFDTCAHGQTLKCLTVVDEWTRESLAIDVVGGIRSGRVIEVLTQLVSVHGAPRYLRSDNGPEFVAGAILRWLLQAQIETALIEPGKPWQNATDESFNGKFRDEYLSLQWFRNRVDAKVGIEQWRRHYNEVRPHSSLGYLTPAEFKAQLSAGSDDGGRSPAMPARADQEEHGDERRTSTGAVLQ